MTKAVEAHGFKRVVEDSHYVFLGEGQQNTG